MIRCNRSLWFLRNIVLLKTSISVLIVILLSVYSIPGFNCTAMQILLVDNTLLMVLFNLSLPERWNLWMYMNILISCMIFWRIEVSFELIWIKHGRMLRCSYGRWRHYNKIIISLLNYRYYLLFTM